MDFKEVEQNYKHKTPIQVRFKDIDKLGHVNNAVHLTYFETARVLYFNKVFRNQINWIKTGMILASSQIVYKQPIFLEDELYCYTRINRFGVKSFEIENVLVVQINDEHKVCAFGKSTLVCMDYETKQTVEIPKEWIQSVNLFEKVPAIIKS